MRIPSEGLYNLYVVDPSEADQGALAARDGSGPAKHMNWLDRTGDRPMSALHIDGDLFTLENGAITRFVSGKNDAGRAAQRHAAAGDAQLQPPAGGGERREGIVYGYDRRNARLIAIGKGDGHYIAQYRLAGDADGWEDMRGFYVAPPGEDAEGAGDRLDLARRRPPGRARGRVRRTRSPAWAIRGYICSPSPAP